MKKARNDQKIRPCDALRALRQRAGYTAEEVRKALVFRSPSSYAKYENGERGEKPIPPKIIDALIPLFVGRGSPQITADEVMALGRSKYDIHLAVVTGPMPNSGYLSGVQLSSATQSKVGSLPVRARAERGAFMEESIAAKDYGPSPIAGLADIAVPIEAQFCMLVVDDHAEKLGYPSGTALHCCFPDQCGPAGPPKGKKVGVWLQRRNSDLGEMLIGVFEKQGKAGEWIVTDGDGNQLRGKPVGIVMRSLRKE